MNNGRESFESDTLRLTAAAEDAGSRLDAFIGWNTNELSRSYAVRLIENGNPANNGQPSSLLLKERALSPLLIFCLFGFNGSQDLLPDRYVIVFLTVS